MTHAHEDSQGHPNRVILDADQPYLDLIAGLGGKPVPTQIILGAVGRGKSSTEEGCSRG